MSLNITLWSTTSYVKKLYKAICGFKGKSDILPQVMSLESVLVGSENYKFESKEKYRGVESELKK